MTRNVLMIMASMFMAFAIGTFTQETLAATVEAANHATPTVVTEMTEVTVVVNPHGVTATLADDATPTTGEDFARDNITNGLWLILAGVVALVGVWWKKRKLAAKAQS